MSLLRPFSASDLFHVNPINLDLWTETYSVGYYLTYLNEWSDLFSVVQSASGLRTAYVMGKTEGSGPEWHGHVSAITVAPSHRRLGLASSLMGLLEGVSDAQQAYFVDLFVRQSNLLAIGLYESLGYTIFRTVKGYYSGGAADASDDEDAYDMRKPLAIDKQKQSIKLPKGAKSGKDVFVRPEDLHFN